MCPQSRGEGKSIPKILWLGLVVLGIGLSGCQRQAATPSFAGAVKDLPPLGPPRKFQEGILVREAKWGAGLTSGQIWVYLPEKPPDGKLPCVLVAPAGSTLLEGMVLADGDRPEQLPYLFSGSASSLYRYQPSFFTWILR